MNILLVTEIYHKGGLDTFIRNLLSYWPCSTDQFTIHINGNYPGLKSQFSILTGSRVDIVYFAGRGIVTDGQSFYYSVSIGIKKLIRKTFYYPFLLPFFICSYIRLLIERKTDALFVVNGGHPGSLRCRAAIFAAGILNLLVSHNIKIIYNVHNSPIDLFYIAKIPEFVLDSTLVYFSHALITVSNATKDDFRYVNKAFNTNKFIVIPNGVVVNKPRFGEGVKYSEHRNRKYCLMLATYEERKGHRFLFDAFKIVNKSYPDVYLDIYGHGLAGEIERVKSSLSASKVKNVTLNGFAENASQLISDALMVVVPSQSMESFGLVIIEAMSLGVPFVVTDIGGISEVVGQSNAGLISSVDDHKTFAKNIEFLLEDPLRREIFGSNGRSYYERFYSVHKMTKSYRDVLTQLAKTGVDSATE
jgi:glycosyltransferase involved in cell wall biosynthesis